MSRRMKTKIAHIQGALGGWLEHEGVQGWMVVPSAITFPWSRTSGWENSSRCQWWSSLFWIRRVTPEELHSLSKTTKLLLLDSLLQEVCIESGSDGSLALSSLGLSVCLVSHNLLYSGLKKAHSTLKFIMNKNSECLNIYAKWPSKIFEDYFCKSTIGIALKNVGVHDLLGWQMQAVPDFTAVFF